MNLEETIQKIESWVQEHELDLLHGIIEGKNFVKVVCDADDTDIWKFLNLGKKSDAKIFIMYKGIFQSEDILGDLQTIDEEGERESSVHIKNLQKYDGEIEFLSISWLLNNTIFEYFEIANWCEKVDEIKTKIFKSNIKGVANMGEINKQYNLSRTRINEIAKIVAEHPDFFPNLYNYNRTGTIISEALEQNEIPEATLGFSDKNLIQIEARAYFDRYLLKEREKEMVEKISQLKNQNLSKVAIRSKLGISERMLNKYFD